MSAAVIVERYRRPGLRFILRRAVDYIGPENVNFHVVTLPGSELFIFILALPKEGEINSHRCERVSY